MMVVVSTTPAYSHAVQRRKGPNNECKEIVKTLIQLEPGDLESFINDIKVSLELGKNNTTRVSEASFIRKNLTENKDKSSA